MMDNGILIVAEKKDDLGCNREHLERSLNQIFIVVQGPRFLFKNNDETLVKYGI